MDCRTPDARELAAVRTADAAVFTDSTFSGPQHAISATAADAPVHRYELAEYGNSAIPIIGSAGNT